MVFRKYGNTALLDYWEYQQQKEVNDYLKIPLKNLTLK
jgi:hypothetical protein